MIGYRAEFDMTDMATEHARRIAKEYDQRVLEILEKNYGFVCPVRCRNCKRTEDKAGSHGLLWCWYQERRVEPDGFCAWGVRRDA